MKGPESAGSGSHLQDRVQDYLSVSLHPDPDQKQCLSIRSQMHYKTY